MNETLQPTILEKLVKNPFIKAATIASLFIPHSVEAQIPLGNLDPMTASQLTNVPVILSNNNFNGKNRACLWANTDIKLDENTGINITTGACNLPNGDNTFSGQVSALIKPSANTFIAPYIHAEQNLNGQSNSATIFGVAGGIQFSKDFGATVLLENQGGDNLARLNVLFGNKK